MNQVRAVFPQIPTDHARRLAELFDSARLVSLRMELAGEPRVAGNRMVFECRHFLAARLKDGTDRKPAESRARIQAMRQGNAWIVTAIEFITRGRSLYPPL